jgi:hypothetical protein
MSETKHSPEPWESVETIGGRFYVADNDEDPLADMRQGFAEQGANARRIVACVNAFAGIPTTSVEVIERQCWHDPSLACSCLVCKAREALAALRDLGRTP